VHALAAWAGERRRCALLGLPGVLLALPGVVVLQVIAQKVLVEQIMDQW
jgi:hypothetical protein